MHEIIEIPTSITVPSAETVLKTQGVPTDKISVSDTLMPLAQKATVIYRSQAAPRGKIIEISKTDFERVYNGEGLNDESTPLDEIYHAANHLAFFAVTIGEAINLMIAKLFVAQEFALGAMLDSAASEGVELAAGSLEDHYKNYLQKNGKFGTSSATMQFSPGYCGWHISGQKRLFEYSCLVDIGITLSENYLMSPLKSITGVIIAGNKEIFKFDDDFPCCENCESRSCRDRINALYSH
jgi:hypothetical protein